VSARERALQAFDIVNVALHGFGTERSERSSFIGLHIPR